MQNENAFKNDIKNSSYYVLNSLYNIVKSKLSCDEKRENCVNCDVLIKELAYDNNPLCLECNMLFGETYEILSDKSDEILSFVYLEIKNEMKLRNFSGVEKAFFNQSNPTCSSFSN